MPNGVMAPMIFLHETSHSLTDYRGVLEWTGGKRRFEGTKREVFVSYDIQTNLNMEKIRAHTPAHTHIYYTVYAAHLNFAHFW